MAEKPPWGQGLVERSGLAPPQQGTTRSINERTVRLTVVPLNVTAIDVLGERSMPRGCFVPLSEDANLFEVFRYNRLYIPVTEPARNEAVLCLACATKTRPQKKRRLRSQPSAPIRRRWSGLEV